LRSIRIKRRTCQQQVLFLFYSQFHSLEKVAI
jgi:hypothetical protein